MKNIISATLLAFVFITFMARIANATDWYVVNNADKKCIRDEGPSKFIGMLQEINSPYTVTDTKDGEKITKVRVEAPAQGFGINYYNGKEECLKVQTKNSAKNKAELDKYK